MLKMLHTLLQELQAAGRMVSVHVDGYAKSGFSAGVVQSLSRTHLQLATYARDGKSDGSETLPLAAIVAVEWDGEYERLMEHLHSADFTPNPILHQVTAEDEDLVRAALQAALNSESLVVVRAVPDREELIGYVGGLDGDWLRLRHRTWLGAEDGQVVLRLSQIVQVEMGSSYCQRLEFLASRQGPRSIPRPVRSSTRPRGAD